MVATLILLNYVTAFVSTRSRAVDKLLQGTPVVLVRNGVLRPDVLRRHNIPEGDLREAMRSRQLQSYEDVSLALLEPDGDISLFKREPAN